MEFVANHILTLVIFFPLAGVLLVLLVPKEEKKLLHALGVGVALVEFLLSLHLYFHFQNTGTFEFQEIHSWIPLWKIQYLVAIDGVSLLLILLTTLLMPLALLTSVKSVEEHVKEYIVSMLLLEVGIIGVFCALDLFLFYVFWEVMLVPMYFIIGVWGGKRKIYAALKFFIFTMSGSVLMLIGILYLYFDAVPHTFNLLDLYDHRLAFTPQLWVFAAFALAFAIKVPLFPLHTWLPDAHVEAPTAGSVILAGVLLKMGTYGFFRFAMPLFPDALHVFQPYLIVLAVVSIIYGALVAMVQTDIKKLIAYSSVSHMGVIMLGLFSLNPTGVEGGLYQMYNHGISTGALFLLVGVLYERTHSRAIVEHAGLSQSAPWFAAIFIVVSLSSMGLPLTNGFVGEFLSLAGAFQTHPMAAILGSTAVVLAAVYLLWLIERIFFGAKKVPVGTGFADVSKREVLIFFPLLMLIFWMGVYPQPFLSKLDRPVAYLFDLMQGSQMAEQGK